MRIGNLSGRLTIFTDEGPSTWGGPAAAGSAPRRRSRIRPARHPTVFTKFVSPFAGPTGEIALGGLGGRTRGRDRTARPPGGARRCLGSHRRTDGRTGPPSERTVQMAGPAPQFSLGKSFPRIRCFAVGS